MFAFPSFLNLGLWAGLAAAAVPLVIHLLSKRRFRRTEWAAMHLLLEAVRRSSRRLQIEQWLLLGLRTLLILLTALAMMQPVYESAATGATATGRRTLRIVVLDGSFSMACRTEGGTIFERAKQSAAEIVRRGSLGDGTVLLVWSEPLRDVIREPSFESADVLDQIAALRQPEGRGSPLALAEALAERVERFRREFPDFAAVEVHVLTDLGRSTWNSTTLTEPVRQRLTAAARQADLHVIDLGVDGLRNMAVADVRLTGQYAVAGEPAVIEYRLANFGGRAETGRNLQLLVDGQLAGERTFDLAGQAELSGTFTHRFPTPADHAVELRLAEDDLPLDDRRFLVVPVRTAVEVLLIDGEPVGGGAVGPTEYLRQALAPQNGNNAAAAGAVRPTVAGENFLVETADLDRFDCIFLCHVRRFSEPEAERLDRYVRNGGGVVFLPGDRIQPESWNRWLAGDDPRAPKLLPVRIGPLRSVPGDKPPLHPNPLAYAHELLTLFRGNERAGLTVLPLRNTFRLEPRPDVDWREVLRVGDDSPLLVESRRERGRVVVFATGLDPNTGLSPKSFVFLPLMHEVLKFAARDVGRDRNLQVGGVLPGNLVRNPSDTPWAGRNLLADPPAADEPPSGRTGFFVCDLPGRDVPYGLAAISIDPRESDLSKLPPRTLEQEIWSGVNFSVWNAPPDRPEATVVPTSTRNDFYRYLLYAALVVLFLETLLARKLGYHTA